MARSLSHLHPSTPHPCRVTRRQVRRRMEDENRKARRVARREFNDQVRRGGGVLVWQKAAVEQHHVDSIARFDEMQCCGCVHGDATHVRSHNRCRQWRLVWGSSMFGIPRRRRARRSSVQCCGRAAAGEHDSITIVPKHMPMVHQGACIPPRSWVQMTLRCYPRSCSAAAQLPRTPCTCNSP